METPRVDSFTRGLYDESAAQAAGYSTADRSPEEAYGLAVDLARQLERENTCMKDNAARYRWLRSEEVATNPKHAEFWLRFGMKLCREEKMDALIDAEMAKAAS